MDYYPVEFTAEARANIVAAKIRADIEFMAIPGMPVLSVLAWILPVFAAFAREACDVARTGIWTVDKADRHARECLRLLTIEAQYKFRSQSFDVPDLIGDSEILPEIQRTIESEHRWKAYQRELLEVAQERGSGVSKYLPAPIPYDEPREYVAPDNTEFTENEEEPSPISKESEIERRAALLRVYRDATGVSNRKIYSARNSIHKPEFYSWIKGDLPSDSATAINFERFLKLMKKPIPRVPKK